MDPNKNTSTNSNGSSTPNPTISPSDSFSTPTNPSASATPSASYTNSTIADPTLVNPAPTNPIPTDPTTYTNSTPTPTSSANTNATPTDSAFANSVYANSAFTANTPEVSSSDTYSNPFGSKITRKLPGSNSSHRSDDVILVPDAPKQKSSGNKKSIIFAIAVVVVLAACGITTFILTQGNNKSADTADTPTSTPPTSTTTPAEPITPTTDLGKAWMHYATYNTDGEEKDEGLAGEYDRYTYYEGIDKASSEELVEREAYFNKARSLFQDFYNNYSNSNSKNTELTKILDLHQERFNFISAYQSTTVYGQSEIFQRAADFGPEAAISILTAPYTSVTYQDTTLQQYNASMIELINVYVDSYSLMSSNGCLTDYNICANNSEVNTVLNTNMDTANQLINKTSEIVSNNHDAYMKELWEISGRLEGDK